MTNTQEQQHSESSNSASGRLNRALKDAVSRPLRCSSAKSRDANRLTLAATRFSRVLPSGAVHLTGLGVEAGLLEPASGYSADRRHWSSLQSSFVATAGCCLAYIHGTRNTKHGRLAKTENPASRPSLYWPFGDKRRISQSSLECRSV
jgi:hypothetical protein